MCESCQGGKSRFISSRHLPEIAAMFPRFKLSTIRNCGHWVHSEDPETTIKNVQVCVCVCACVRACVRFKILSSTLYRLFYSKYTRALT